MAMARAYRQNSISQLLRPLNGDPFAKTIRRVSVAPAAFAIRGGARASSPSPGGDFAAAPPPEEKRAARKAPRAPRRLITISTSDGKWHGEWNCDYMFTLRELGVADVAEGGQGDSKVLISLVIHKVGLLVAISSSSSSSRFGGMTCSFRGRRLGNCSTPGSDSQWKGESARPSLGDAAAASPRTLKRF